MSKPIFFVPARGKLVQATFPVLNIANERPKKYEYFFVEGGFRQSKRECSIRQFQYQNSKSEAQCVVPPRYRLERRRNPFSAGFRTQKTKSEITSEEKDADAARNYAAKETIGFIPP